MTASEQQSLDGYEGVNRHNRMVLVDMSHIADFDCPAADHPVSYQVSVRQRIDKVRKLDLPGGAGGGVYLDLGCVDRAVTEQTTSDLNERIHGRHAVLDSERSGGSSVNRCAIQDPVADQPGWQSVDEPLDLDLTVRPRNRQDLNLGSIDRTVILDQSLDLNEIPQSYRAHV